MKESPKRNAPGQTERQPAELTKEHVNFADIDHELERASQLFRDNRLSEAEEICHHIIELSPDHPRALHALGVFAYRDGRTDSAIGLINQALAIKPDYAEAFSFLGMVLHNQGKLTEAEASYRKALALDPCLVEAHNDLGITLKSQGRMSEAEACYRKAIALKKDCEKSYSNLGVLLMGQGRLTEAESNYRKALAIKPSFAEARDHLSVLLMMQGRADEAVASHLKTLKSHSNIIAAHSNLLFSMNFLPRFSQGDIFHESLRWDALHGKLHVANLKAHPNSPDFNRRLRIGYISPDFREHSVSYFFEPLLAAHHLDQVHVFCYSCVENPDVTTSRLKLLSHRWRDCYGLSDAVVAEQIRKDRIDILIDLAGHTAGNRLPVFTWKPSPVQVSWLGYPNTTGMAAIDYRLTDAVADPAGAADLYHSEKLYRLPRGFLCYAPPRNAPAVSSLPSLDKGYVTFGSFNNLAKMTSEVMALWAVVLQRIPGARLFLKNLSFTDYHTRERCLKIFAGHGIDPERIETATMVESTSDHLALYSRMDISLDTFPYNGTTTTCESLWMGVPVVTLRGDRHAGRVGASILTRIGLEEFIAESEAEYIEIAVRKANDLNYLANLRSALRDRMGRSPLCDADTFAQDMETAYRQMWRTWCSEQNRHETAVCCPTLPTDTGDGAISVKIDGQVMSLDEAFALASRYLAADNKEEALAVCRQIDTFCPNLPRTLHAFGVIAYLCGKTESALEYIHKALELLPDYMDALGSLGNIYREQSKLVDAVDCYRKALHLQPDIVTIDTGRGGTSREFAKYVEIHSNYLFLMNYMEEYSVGDILEESHKWGALYVKKELVKSETYGNVPDPERRLRIGYVSKDFGRHPVGYFLLPVLSSHDHASVEVYCYSGRIREDDVTGRLRESADVWRSTTDLDDRDLASMVRDDSIDILVDLSGHTGGSRLLVFAEKPAPIQVSWAGYAGTTGLSTMDYLISDWRETPEGSDRWYVEKVVRLPDCYVCYEPPEYAPPVVPLPALKKGHVTFGCFNNLAKVRPGVVALWSKILREIPNARLLMITKQLSDPDTRRRYLEMFSAGGVGERVDLSGDRPHIDLLAGYGEIDIALDPFPYSGGLTTLESLWMGVPVITLGGDRFASRHSLSHLTAVGLPELIASGPDDYIARAVGLACDPERLATLRRELRPRMAASPLCDGSRFTRNLEDAYRYMWRSWCAGKIHRLKTM